MLQKIISTKPLRKILLGSAALMLVIALMPFAAKALTVSPVTLELDGDPGQTLTGQVTLTNETDKTQTYTSSIEEVSAEQETGDPLFSEGGTDIGTWVTVAKSVTLEPGNSTDVDYTVVIPADATPGGHFAAILWSTTDASQKPADVKISAKVGALMFITVSGQIIESGDIIEVGLQNGRSTMSYLPADLFYRFQNTGNDRVIPKGTVTVSNWFGREKDSINANAADGSVLPQSIREFDLTWDPSDYGDESVNFFGAVGRQLTNFAFGNYTAEVALSFGAGNQTAVASASFFIFPWQLFLTILIVILIIAYLVVLARGRDNKKKK